MRPLLLLALASLLPASTVLAQDSLERIARARSSDAFPTETHNRDAARLLLEMRTSIEGGLPEGSDERAGAMSDLTDRARHLSSCEWGNFSGRPEPDRAMAVEGLIGEGAMYYIMNYGDADTDRVANAGMISYMAQSVSVDCSLYKAAYIFYRDLKRLDLRSRPAPHSSGGCEISARSSRNLLSLANEAVGQVLPTGNIYLAMKVLALFGHDNRYNALTTHAPAGTAGQCQLVILDAMRPNMNSNLYLNGAVGKSYTAEDIRLGTEAHRLCSAAARDDAEHELCGWQDEYQADYYHVIASAFLHCARAARSLSFPDALEESLYLNRVREYKNERFQEKMRANASNPAIRVLARAWERRMSGETVASADWTRWCEASHCSETDLTFARALYALFAFEFNFRVHQHQLGIELAHEQCGSANARHPLSCYYFDAPAGPIR